MKVLIVGGLGSIGSRYNAILKYIGEDPIVYDTNQSKPELPPKWDMAIVATPTDSHYAICKDLMKTGKPFLCEKPLSRNLKECEDLAECKTGYVVNNYQFLIHPYENVHFEYDYYRTGKDGVYWDCSQLIYMDKDCVLKNHSPVWSFKINGKSVLYRDLECSYIYMLEAFVNGNYSKLWTLKQGAQMSQCVVERMRREDHRRDTSAF